MKAFPLVLTLALLGLALPDSSVAESPAAPTAPSPFVPSPDDRARAAKWNVAVDVQMIAMPLDLALVFIPDLQSPDEAKVNAAVVQLQDLLKKKQAILLGWPRATGVDGWRSVSETVVEKRYPTEFDPPQEPQTFPANPDAQKRPLTLAPKAFETRNLGVALEVESQVLNDEGDLLVNLVSNRTTLLGFDDFWWGLTTAGQQVHVAQPQFALTRITTALKLRSGQYALIGLHQLTEPKDHVELVIVHAVAIKVR